jgi:alpha-methylacyl-CoA racemase
MKQRMGEIFKSKTRDEWCEIMEGSDVCFAPVLTMSEAPKHPHMKARGTFVDAEGGKFQAGPSPRFSRTPGAVQGPAPIIGQHTDEVLGDFGFSGEEIAKLREAKAIA